MKRDVYCDRSEAAILEDDREYTKGEKILYDCDGNELFAFPGPGEWQDWQILTALDFANQAYERGVAVGRSRKAYEIRTALGGD